MKRIIETIFQLKLDFFVVNRLKIALKTGLIKKEQLEAKLFANKITLQEYFKIIGI